MTEEHRIQNAIRAAVAPYAVIFRVNVGAGQTPDGRYFSTGVPVGFPDLFGVRLKDGKAIFIEVKTPRGRATVQQMNFISRMKAAGAVAGICRSAEDAIELVVSDRQQTTEINQTNDAGTEGQCPRKLSTRR